MMSFGPSLRFRVKKGLSIKASKGFGSTLHPRVGPQSL